MVSDYCQLPHCLRKKRSILNVRNNDAYSILYCLSAALRRTKPAQHKTRKSNYNISKLKITDISFQTNLCSIPKLEDLNSLKINVFTFDEKLTSVYTSNKSNYRKKVDLLLLQNHLNLPHYAYIINMKLLVKNTNSYEYICRSCFRFFKTNDMYEEHLPECTGNVIEIPKKLKRKTGLNFVQCDETQDYLQYSITAALFPLYNTQQRFCTKASLYTILNNSMFYPNTQGKSLLDCVDCIGAACQVNINIFLYSENEVVPYIIPKTHHARFVDLLMIQKGNRQVFMIIKDLSSIYYQRTGAKHYVCRRCLQIEVCPKRFREHEDLCDNFKTQKVKLSDKKELRFRNIRKQFPELFTVFAGKSCCLI